jgi:hypothetical protein
LGPDHHRSSNYNSVPPYGLSSGHCGILSEIASGRVLRRKLGWHQLIELLDRAVLGDPVESVTRVPSLRFDRTRRVFSQYASGWAAILRHSSRHLAYRGDSSASAALIRPYRNRHASARSTTSGFGCILLSMSPRSSTFTASCSRLSPRWSASSARAIAEERLLPRSQWIAISGGSTLGPSKNPSPSCWDGALNGKGPDRPAGALLLSLRRPSSCGA